MGRAVNYVITGSIGAGKSTAVKKIIEKGFNVLDSDEIVNDLYKEGYRGYDLVREHFGEEFVTDTEVNKPKLREAIKKDPSILHRLETLIHPLVLEVIESELENDINFIDIPLYFEKKELFKFPHKVIVVWATREQQFARIQSRDNLNDEDIMRIMDLQMDTDTKKEMADYVIDNSGTEEDLNFEIDTLLRELKLAKKD